MSTEGDAVLYPREIGLLHTLRGLLLRPMSPNTATYYCFSYLLTAILRCLQAVIVTVRLRARVQNQLSLQGMIRHLLMIQLHCICSRLH